MVPIELLHRAKMHDSAADTQCESDVHHTKSLDAIDAPVPRVHGGWGRYYGSNQLVWCTNLPVLMVPIELLHRAKMHDSAADTHCESDVHHTKSLDAIDAPVPRVHGGRGRYYGSNQPVWCTNLPVLMVLIELLHRAKIHDSAADTHCESDVHHTKSLDAIDAPVLRVHGGRGRHYGSNQPVWCTNLPVLMVPIELLHRAKMHDSAADTHCVSDVHHTKSLDAIDAPVLRVHGGRGRYYGSNQPVWCTNLPVLMVPIKLLHRAKIHDSAADTHCESDVHHTKSLDAIDAPVTRVHGGRGRYYGSNQLVCCTNLPVLMVPIELLHRAKMHDSAADTQCESDVHHTKSLDAIDAPVLRVHGGRGRYYGSNQPVWCTNLYRC